MERDFVAKTQICKAVIDSCYKETVKFIVTGEYAAKGKETLKSCIRVTYGSVT